MEVSVYCRYLSKHSHIELYKGYSISLETENIIFPIFLIMFENTKFLYLFNQK